MFPSRSRACGARPVSPGFPDRFQTRTCWTNRNVRLDAKGAVSSAFLGADDGVRTRDPQLGKLMLYQLSYVRAPATIARPEAAGPAGWQAPFPCRFSSLL